MIVTHTPDPVQGPVVYARAVDQYLNTAIEDVNEAFREVWLMDRKRSREIAKEVLEHEADARIKAKIERQNRQWVANQAKAAQADANRAKPKPEPKAKEPKQPKPKAPPRRRKSTPPLSETIRQCSICQSAFSPVTANQITCSAECAKAHKHRHNVEERRQRRRALRAAIPPRNCPLCGKEFIPRNDVQGYCSSLCGRTVRNRTKKKKKASNNDSKNAD